jgi:hypothetical protein
MQDRRPLIIGLNSVLMVLSSITIFARLLTRGFLLKHVGPDDGKCPMQNRLQHRVIMNSTVLISIALILALTLSSLYMLCGSC